MECVFRLAPAVFIALVLITFGGSRLGQAWAAGHAGPAFAPTVARQGGAVLAWFPARPSRCGSAVGPDSYPWPVKPFYVQHPVRAFFGDPRTVFRSSDDAMLGTFSFHNGVDIVAAAGTPVYPVVTGWVVKRKPDEIVVESPAQDRIFQYWHLEAKVRVGDHVFAEQTVLGTVQPTRDHVHLSEIDDTVVTNPLQPGHLTPYQDATTPSVTQVFFRDQRGRPLGAQALHGRVELAAAALDPPPLRLRAPWSGVSVTPARVSWYLSTLAGQELVPEQMPADFSSTIPRASEFWSVYARGTYQNFPAVGDRYFYGTPGEYLFNLTPSPLDTRLLPAGRYRLTVVAEDTCGNRGTLTETVRVRPQSPVAAGSGALVRDLTAGEAVFAWQRRFWTVAIAAGTDRQSSPAPATVSRAAGAHLGPLALVSLPSARVAGSDDQLVVTGAFSNWGSAYTLAEHAAVFFPSASVREIVLRAPPTLRIPIGGNGAGGGYGVVLESVPVRAGLAVARALAREASGGGFPSVRVLTSANFKTLRPGLLCVVSGRYRTAAAATRAAQLDASLYSAAEVRRLVAKPKSRLRSLRVSTTTLVGKREAFVHR